VAKIYDEEDLLISVKDYVKSNLNTEIALINTEKDDDYSIDTITADDTRYVIAGELLDLPNHAFVNFSFEGDIETVNNYDDIKSNVNMLIEVAFDDPKKAGTYYKSLRYMRSVYQTILKYEASVLEIGGLTITKVIPMVITTRGRNLVVSGVGISVSLG